MTAQARLFVFSGRPDPVWDLSPRHIVELEAAWDQLAAAPPEEQAEVPSGLGYRGVEVVDRDRRWVAFRGRARLETASTSQTRLDPDRKLERQIVTSAPAGIVPAGVLPSGW